jgi:predicted nucleotidyltransferase
MELQGVKIEDIKHIYTPRTYFQSLSNAKTLSKIEKVSKDLCELFINEGGISKNCIGITGSQMIGLNKNDSDIDLIIYGTKNGLEFQHSIKQIFNTSDNCRLYNMKEYKKHYNWRVGGSNIPFSTFLQTEMRKLHQGKYQGIDFFIRYIKSPDDWEGDYYDYQFQNLGRIQLKAKIIDSKDAIFTPCNYKIVPLRILNSLISKRKLAFDKINEIFSYRGRFCEQAINGEIVIVEGKLEKVKYRNKQEYFRIVLENQISDKMMVIA